MKTMLIVIICAIIAPAYAAIIAAVFCRDEESCKAEETVEATEEMLQSFDELMSNEFEYMQLEYELQSYGYKASRHKSAVNYNKLERQLSCHRGNNTKYRYKDHRKQTPANLIYEEDIII